MLSIALSLYFSTIPQYCPKLTFDPLAILHQILNHTADVYNISIFANFSDLGNVCNKKSMSLTNFYRSVHYKGIQYIADVFLCRPLKHDDTFLQTYIDKTFAQTCRYPGEILHLFQPCREYYPVRILRTYIYNWQSFLHQIKEVCYRCHSVLCYVIRYQVLYNITYVETHLSLRNLYRTYTLCWQLSKRFWERMGFLSTFENILHVLIWILCLLRCLKLFKRPWSDIFINFGRHPYKNTTLSL